MKKIIMAIAFASVAVPAIAADAPAFTAASEGIEIRYVRGAVTKERSPPFAPVPVTPTEGRWGRYGFTVAVFNKSGAPINIGAENVTATLPDGTTVGVLPAAELVRIATSRARWNAALTALASATITPTAAAPIQTAMAGSAVRASTTRAAATPAA